jgi:hypothetical protein
MEVAGEIKRMVELLKSVKVGDMTIAQAASPVMGVCYKLTNGDPKEFRKCVRDVSFVIMYVADNLELPPGIQVAKEEETSAAIPAEAHSIKYRFKYVKVRV